MHGTKTGLFTVLLRADNARGGFLVMERAEHREVLALSEHLPPLRAHNGN